MSVAFEKTGLRDVTQSTYRRAEGVSGNTSREIARDDVSDSEYKDSPESDRTSSPKDTLADIAEPVNSQDECPDGGYGWIIVMAVFLVNCCTWGVTSSFSIYLAYYLEHDSFPGTSKMEYTLIGGLSVAMVMLCSGPLATVLVRVTSTRKTMLIGVALQVGSLISCSFASLKWHIFLGQAVAYGVGHGLLFSASVATVSQWFKKRRSVANGLVAAGGGAGGLAFTLGVDAAIRNLGLQWSFRVSAIVCFTVNTFCTILTRDRNTHIKPSQSAFAIRLLKITDFLLVLAWMFFCLWGYMPLLFTLADFSKNIGLSGNEPGIVAAMFGLGMTLGRPAVGWLSDRYGNITVSTIATAMTSFFILVLWIPADTGLHDAKFAMSIAFGILGGLGAGTMWTMIAPVCSVVEGVGLKELPSALSIVWLVSVIPCTFATAIALSIRNDGGAHPYLNPQIFSMIMYFIASICLWALRVRVLRRMLRRGKEKATILNGEGPNPLPGDMIKPVKKLGFLTGVFMRAVL